MVEGKEWLVTEDDLTCPLCNRMAGKVKRLNQNYFNLGDKLVAEGTTMVFDYEDVSFPPLHPSCRCTILPVIKETYKPKTAELFEMKYPGLSAILKGGHGSGNFGHAGVPGEVGGSASGRGGGGVSEGSSSSNDVVSSSRGGQESGGSEQSKDGAGRRGHLPPYKSSVALNEEAQNLMNNSKGLDIKTAKQLVNTVIEYSDGYFTEIRRIIVTGKQIGRAHV